MVRAPLLSMPPIVGALLASQRTVFPGAFGALDPLPTLLAFQLGAGSGALASEEVGAFEILASSVAKPFPGVRALGEECPAPFAPLAPIFPLPCPLAHG